MIWGVLVDQATRWLPPLARKLGLAVAGALLLVFAWPAIGIWRSERTLWSAAVEHTPTSARAWTGLSRAFRLSGELDRADEAVERALDLDAGFTYARVTRIYNRLARGDVDEARRELTLVEQDQLEHPGLARARRCAALSAREAPGCIRGN
jgi:tetratricopeptide (TPR) repeat protein